MLEWGIIMEEFIELTYKSPKKKNRLRDDNNLIETCRKDYLNNAAAYVSGMRVENEMFGTSEEPDEFTMRVIEKMMDIPEQGADEFRRDVVKDTNHPLLTLAIKKYIEEVLE